MRAATTGDSAAFAELYRRHHRYVARIVADSVADGAARADVAQTTFEHAWLKIEQLRDPDAFRPWLAQIARRRVIDHHRRSARSQTVDFDASDAAETLADDDWSAHDWLAMRNLARALDVALQNLAARDVTVLELATQFGFGPGEIATAMGIERGHARVVLHRARRRLRAELAATDWGDEAA